MSTAADTLPRWSHFHHGADIGVRGEAATLAQAFEMAAKAMTAVITSLDRVHPSTEIRVTCQAPDPEILLVDWLNALVYEMATRRMLFSEFEVRIETDRLQAVVRGETVDSARHQPAVEVKGATFTELRVRETDAGTWLAQCIVDV